MNRKSIVLSFATLACAAAPALAQDAAHPAAQEKTFFTGVMAVVIGLVTALIALWISLTLAMYAVKKAIQMFDKTTEGIDEWAELGKGNVAVGIVMAAMIYAVGNVISGGVESLTKGLMHPSLSLGFVLGIVIGVINLLISLWIATTVVSLAIKTLDKATEKIEEMKEIGKGNVAVAVMVAGVLLAVSQVVQSAVSGLSNVLNIDNLRAQFGW
jgi:uncharacterized membrane protein YjfL (UPF0719 family)